MPESEKRRSPLLTLDEADLEFVLRLVLASGSLKELARLYGVSYPTIRARLDRLIARLEAARRGRPPDPMADLLAGLVERGELAVGSARAIQELHRQVCQQKQEEG
jgi:hypothetical protein